MPQPEHRSRTYEASLPGDRTIYATCQLTSMPGQKDYFSAIGRIRKAGRRDDDESGAIHEAILDSFPGLKPYVALHLSDIDGVPMHAEANGWYWAGGTRWNGPKRDEPPNAAYLAATLRIDIDEARGIVDKVVRGELLQQDFRAFVEEQKPRWAAEARAALDFLDTGFWPESTPAPRL